MTALDPVIHAEARLRVIATLNSIGENNQISFPKLRKMLDMTAGNLSTHLRKLEEAGYVQQTKLIEGRSPATYVEITTRGRLAFLDYRESLKALLADSAHPVKGPQ
ncbi:transcriptional regulator [Arthrobacter sp. H14]|uniref:transcriptional regulator n=1 Tax=Arthrobacter sp. H14 TaxID=1312959 RepID=UPI00047A84D3|nr:transcriptional regulator [Arthrobacter sp. H14]